MRTPKGFKGLRIQGKYFLPSELPRSKLRGIKFPKKLSSPLMGED